MTEVVISGIGGSFPGSQTVQEFGQDLLDNKYLPTPTKRWKDGNKFGAPAVCGEVPYNNFDGYFFGVSRSLAACSDPVYKIGYQSCFQAIIDAGLSPFSMKGSNVAVYASSGVNEHEQRAVYAKHCMFHGNYLIVGNNRSMMANRMSFLFGFHGPSSAMDFSWAGVHMLLSIAANAIKSGEVNEALIVVSCISKDPELALALRGLGLMSKDGRTRSFDKDASGSVRSDCCVAMFLQRADRAKRCYAKVLASGLEAIGEIDKVLPDPRGIQNFLSNLYRSHSIDPKRIAYMEADGSAHPVRDECELAGVDAALVKGAGRSTPLLVGSVRSNLGYADVATGAAAICKAVVAMETGTIPATIDFREANPNIESLVEGRLRVVDANTPLGLAADSVLAVNSLGLLGSVGHTVLQPNPRAPEPPQDPSLHLPRLVPVAGRTEESVKEAIAKILAAPFDIHYYRLVQDVFSSHINGFTYRSYAICPPAENDVHKVTKLEKRTVWFVYSGMGSQWAGMGAGLMRIPLFAETIERLHAVLVPKGVDLKKILTETGPEAFDNILKSFVGIAACQIALTNVLTAIGVIPDGIVGHSVGEQACAYADGCLTEEQAILAAWARGAASNDATLIKGKMAAVGLGYKDMLPRLPPTIDVACHNSSTSCTLSGPAEDVEHFVKQLSEEGVFARAVDVAGIAYHSRYIQAAGPFLRQHLGSVLTNPKRRSSRWVTTSVPSEKRDEDWTKFCSVEYLTNNLLSPVLFEEALQHIPEQAVVIEIAPHGLLQAILKRALPEPIHIPLTNRGQADADRYLLDAIGKISCTAPVPNVTALYPDTKFPVPRGTPSLANLVLWQADNVDTHDPYEALNEKVAPSLSLVFSTPHVNVNGERLLPSSEILEIMRQAVLAAEGEQAGDKSLVSLRNICFDRSQSLPSLGNALLISEYMPKSADMEVIDEDAHLVAHGRAYLMDIDEQAPPLPDMRPAAREAVTVHKAELYQELTRHGLKYDVKYQNINSILMTEEDWVVTATHNGENSGILESVMQVFLLKAMKEDLDQRAHLPKTIQRLEVDLTKMQKHSDFVLRLHLATGILAGTGVYCSGLTAEPYSVRHALHTLQFVLCGETRYKTPADFLRAAAGSVLETAGKASMKVVQLRKGAKTEQLARAMATAIGASSTAVQQADTGTGPDAGPDATHACLLVTSPLTLAEAEGWLASGRADAVLVWSDERLAPGPGVAVMAEQRFGDGWVSVTQRAAPVTDAVVLQLKARTPTPHDVPGATPVVLAWRGLDEAAMDAAIAEVDVRPYATRARMVFVPDNAPAFSLSAPLYADQLARGARVSVLAEDGSWGCWRTLPLASPLCAALSATKLDDVDLQFLAANPPECAAGLTGPVDYVGVEGAAAAGGRLVMGVARWLADDRRPQPDPLLRWPVPQGWAPEDAVTVPYVYALAYYSLLAKAQARRGESILVHEGTKPFGQAAIRVAAQLGCSPIFTTVRSAEERETLCRIFPQLDPCHVLMCGDGGSFEYRIRVLTRNCGVRIVLNTLAGGELRASVGCLSISGRLLHYNRDDALAGRSIGLNQFLLNIAMLGISGDDLFLGREDDRAQVAEAMREGLRNGVVQPIVGAKVCDASQGLAEFEKKTKTVFKVNPKSVSSSQQCDPSKCYLVISRDAGDALLLATRLAALGARNIAAAVTSPPNAVAVEQRQRALQRRHAAHLHLQRVPRWDLAAARRLVDSVGPLHTALVAVKDDADEALPALVSAALAAAPAVRLVVLSAQPGPQAAALRRLAGLAAARASQGLSTACLAAPLASAVGHLADLVCRAEPPPLTVLTEADAASGPPVAEQPLAVLPVSAAALAAVGQAAARCADGAALRAVRSLALPSRCPSENSTVFVLPPLGVLDPVAAEQLAGLAGRLLSSVLVVEAAVRASIRDTARDVVKLIKGRQPRGPYNILGWGLAAVLALEVQRQLEATGSRGALFLVHGDVRAAVEWAKKAEPARGPAADPEARRGSEAVSRLLNAIANHECDFNRPFEWSVHVVTANDQQSLNENDSNVHLARMLEPGLNHTAMSSYVNENCVTHKDAAYDDMRHAVANKLSTTTRVNGSVA